MSDKIAIILGDPHLLNWAESKFWSKVAKTGCSDDCWEWTCRLNDKGYGIIGIGRALNSIRAHRLSWALRYRSNPDKFLVCHKCDNPKCVNPNHLFLGTNKDNSQDMVKKGRGFEPPHNYDESHHNVKFGLSVSHKIRTDPRPAEALAAELGVSTKTIYRHRRGETWVKVYGCD